MNSNRPRIGVAALVLHEGKVLLGKRRGSIGAGSWSCAGGHLEFGEKIEDCAIRELKEETGLIAKSARVESWSSDIIDDKHYITFFVRIDGFEGALEILEPEKCESWEWFDMANLPFPLFPTIASYFEKLQDLPKEVEPNA